MADQVAVLRHGVIAQLDTPAALYGRPGDVELAQFLGESNVLDGEVHDGTASTALGSLAVARGDGPSGGGRARVMVRPEQIRLRGAPERRGGGHRAELRVLRPRCRRAGAARWRRPPDLVVRVTGGVPVEPGRRVGLSVLGAVVVWPQESAEAEDPPE